MLSAWLRERRRRRLLAEPFPEPWLASLERLPFYRQLAPEEQATLRDSVRVFVAEKYWEGCGGLQLTDEMRVVIAAQACLLTLHLPEKLYPNVRSIFVYPSTFRVRVQRTGPMGIVTEGASHRLGEAWSDGPVVLSWRAAGEGVRRPDDGENVVFHEFAHKLDMQDGRVDDTPPLPDEAAYARWDAVMERERRLLGAMARRGMPALIDPSAARERGELFAFATEAFFELPRLLRARRPRLYAVLRDYYRQDPAARLPEDPGP